MRHAALPAACLAAAAALVPAPAAAQHPCPGQISATALRPVPADAVIGARLASDTDLQVQFRDSLFAALRQAGRRVGEPPTHVLSWRGSLGTADAALGPSRTDLLWNERDSFQDSDDLSWMRGVPRTRRPGAAPAPLRLHATIELREVAGGRVIWTAVLSCERHGEDRNALIGTLVGAVVPALGQTLAGRRF